MRPIRRAALRSIAAPEFVQSKAVISGDVELNYLVIRGQSVERSNGAIRKHVEFKHRVDGSLTIRVFDSFDSSAIDRIDLPAPAGDRLIAALQAPYSPDRLA